MFSIGGGTRNKAWHGHNLKFLPTSSLWYCLISASSTPCKSRMGVLEGNGETLASNHIPDWVDPSLISRGKLPICARTTRKFAIFWVMLYSCASLWESPKSCGVILANWKHRFGYQCSPILQRNSDSKSLVGIIFRGRKNCSDFHQNDTFVGKRCGMTPPPPHHHQHQPPHAQGVSARVASYCTTCFGSGTSTGRCFCRLMGVVFPRLVIDLKFWNIGKGRVVGNSCFKSGTFWDFFLYVMVKPAWTLCMTSHNLWAHDKPFTTPIRCPGQVIWPKEIPPSCCTRTSCKGPLCGCLLLVNGSSGNCTCVRLCFRGRVETTIESLL